MREDVQQLLTRQLLQQQHHLFICTFLSGQGIRCPRVAPHCREFSFSPVECLPFAGLFNSQNGGPPSKACTWFTFVPTPVLFRRGSTGDEVVWKTIPHFLALCCTAPLRLRDLYLSSSSLSVHSSFCSSATASLSLSPPP